MIISSPVVITGNEARYDGGAIFVEEATITLPADADISGNTATFVSSGRTLRVIQQRKQQPVFRLCSATGRACGEAPRGLERTTWDRSFCEQPLCLSTRSRQRSG